MRRRLASLPELLLLLLLLFVVVVVRDTGVAGGGGVIEPELPFLTGELHPFRLVRCCCGDRGVTTRAPSGESGVLHCSLFPKKNMKQKREKIILRLFVFFCCQGHT